MASRGILSGAYMLFTYPLAFVAASVAPLLFPRKCSEHFHDRDVRTAKEDLYPCTSCRHMQPTYVCRRCIATSETWVLDPYAYERLGLDRHDDGPLDPILQDALFQPLCLHCTATAIKRFGLGNEGCKCGSLEPEQWLCFACRDLNTFLGKTALADIEMQAERANRHRTKHGKEEVMHCPGCEGWFKVRDTPHAQICLGCSGICTQNLDSFEDEIFEYASKPSQSAAYPPLEGARWMHPSGNANRKNAAPGGEFSPTASWALSMLTHD